MSTSPDRQIIIELVIKTGHPALLEGLDAWLHLGLISDAFVRQLCQRELICPLPSSVAIAISESPTDDLATEALTALQIPAGVGDRQQSTRRNPQPNLISQTVQAFMAEVSVVWLLFLGVFLVVVSSAVLAATQWQQVSPVGQYGILFGYTLAFGIASQWTQNRSSVQLTSRMLTIATLLLIPVNFWMMDGFRLWQPFPDAGVVAIAAIVLTGFTLRLLRSSRSIGIVAVVILLSWLHWGWRQPGIPFLATYIGTIAATVALLVQDRQPPQTLEDSDAEHQPTAPGTLATFNLTTIAIVLSALLLAGRALFVERIPVNQLGLAIGICGWLLCWLARRDRTRFGWSRAGTVLLLLAWLITVNEIPPWQTVAITGLSLGLLINGLWRTGRSLYLISGFLVGLPLGWLLWRLVPSIGRSHLVNWCIAQAGAEAMPNALQGLAYFPYVMAMAGFALYLRRRQYLTLARDSEWLAVGLGSLLVAQSLGNPLVRSLTLTLSTVTLLGVAAYRRPSSTFLIYLTHGTALTTGFAWIHYRFPTLNPNLWLGLLLVAIVLEWLYATTNRQQQWTLWTQAAWHFGILLAGISSVLFWTYPWTFDPAWKLGWFIVPGLLTRFSYRDRFPDRRMAAGLSILFLAIVQPLQIETPSTRLISFAIATGLMLLNTRQLQYVGIAILTVGFGLGFWFLTLYEVFQQKLTIGGFAIALSLTVLLLWGLHGWVCQRRSRLDQLYQQALDWWAIAGLLFTLLLLSLTQLAAYIELEPSHWHYLVASSVLVASTFYRTWQRPDRFTWYAIAASLELLAITGLFLHRRSLSDLAIATIALGFVAQLAGDRWIHQQSASDLPPASWHIIPLAYGILGLLLAHTQFTAATGFYTLAVAILGTQIGRRSPQFLPIVLLSLIGVSLGAYELLIYQLSQATGGSPGDGILLLAALAAAIASLQQILSRPLATYLRIAVITLRQIADCHWLLANIFLLTTIPFPLSRTGQWGWSGIALFLTAYALARSYHRFTAPSTDIFLPESDTFLPENEDLALASASVLSHQFWLYAGILELLAAIASLLWLLLPTTLLIDWAGSIAAIGAVVFYVAPWQQWGWNQRPWRQTAAFLPGLVMLLTGWGANLQSLLMVAAFYAWVASAEQQIRLSYVSVLLTNWALIRLLQLYNLTQPLWYAVIWGSSILYLAQVDPALHHQARYEQRHWLRSLATGLICLTGFYQAQIGISGVSLFVAGFIAIAIDFGAIVLGLIQRVRAFLYVGTLTFLLQILWQLWRFVQAYSVLLWALGIVAGLILIWVAATFEARKTQVNVLLQHWVTELEDWQ